LKFDEEVADMAFEILNADAAKQRRTADEPGAWK